ncbi:threonine aldolase family protein [Euzebya tangerina]|uniref:threonine aldolase family protein n=1 Tax=Euzebya tangerina TaxID=591198 RepID=UPI000E3230E7|nr:low specificity L-threonine aldolase [Euzebya tangerina]
MNFASDNIVGVHPAILQALIDANAGPQAAYGEDEHTGQAVADLSAVFETDLEAFLVTTGTAANSLSLAAMAPPFGAVFCHEDAHIAVDECGAPEFFTGGAKLFGLPGPTGKITPETVTATLDGFVKGVHDPMPAAISITQATELGTLYTPAEIRALADLAHAHDMGLHMDGARFANALVSLGCSAAEMTWQAGVDILSFGGTKNGAMTLEVVTIFDPQLATDFNYRRMKAGQLLSKGRYLGAQLTAYLADDLWLANARHANAMATRLANGLAETEGVRLPLPTPANEVFPIMPRSVMERLHQSGAAFYEWPGNGPGTDSIGPDEAFVRLVCSFTTTTDEVDTFLELVATTAGQAA